MKNAKSVCIHEVHKRREEKAASMINPIDVIEEIELRAQTSMLEQQKEDLIISISLLKAKLFRLNIEVQKAIEKDCELSTQ